jgi:hypothetical protein
MAGIPVTIDPANMAGSSSVVPDTGSPGSTGGGAWGFGSLFQTEPKGTPTFVRGAGFRVRNPDGSYRHLRSDEVNQNGVNYADYGPAWTAENQRLQNERDDKNEQALTSRTIAADNAKLQLLIGEQKRQNLLAQGTLEQIKSQQKLATDTLAATTASRNKDRTQQGDQFTQTMGLNARQMEINNDLLKDKMLLEDKHFQQNLAYKAKQDRRAQVISSLSLVAQSLSKL